MISNPGNRDGSHLIDTPTGMIHAVQSGLKGAPTLLFLHGNYFGLPQWDSWINHLSTDYNCLRLDLSGFGLSHPPRGGIYSDAGDLAAVAGVLAAYEIDQMHIIGSSLGGKIAYQLAAYQPYRVKSLILINSAGLPHHAADASQPTLIPEETKNSILSAPETFVEQLFVGLKGSKGKIAAELIQELTLLTAKPRIIREILKRMESYTVGPARRTLAGVGCPVLIMHGQENPQYAYTDVQIFKELLSKAPMIDTHIAGGHGQLLPMEGCYEALQKVKNFLDHHRKYLGE